MSEILRVLLVEDNPADADLVREALPKTGPPAFRLEVVTRLADALARLGDGGIDLVLLDLNLPDGQGLETFHKLHHAVPALPVVVLTGNMDQELAVETVKKGAQDYLVKGR